MEVEINGQGSTAEQLESDNRGCEDEGVRRVALDESEPLVASLDLMFLGTLLIAICALSVSFFTGHVASLPFHGHRFDEDGFKRC